MDSNRAPSGRPSQRQRLLEARITKLEAEAKAIDVALADALATVKAQTETMHRLQRWAASLQVQCMG